MRSLDVLANRYGKLPHELVPDFPTDDPYVIYCFNEAVAIAGLSQMPAAGRIGEKSMVERAPTPTDGAVIGMRHGVPYIAGKIPVAKKRA